VSWCEISAQHDFSSVYTCDFVSSKIFRGEVSNFFVPFQDFLSASQHLVLALTKSDRRHVTTAYGYGGATVKKGSSRRETGVGGSEESRSWVNGIHGRG